MQDDFLQRLRAAADIVQIVSRTVSLKKTGKSFLGLCPFHQEKTPSFHVYPDNQSFYCFGCKKSGSVFDFVMSRDGIDFRGARDLLARELNIPLPEFRGDPEKASERKQLYEAQQSALKFFRRMLLERGKAARDYLAKRGFTDSTCDAFGVGFAPDSWDALLTAPEMKPFAPDLLHRAGLLKIRESEGGYYDTFRGRVMFPIRDETGRPIAFGGRVLPGSDAPAKYLNSPETPLFSKGRCAFGIDQARTRMIETRTAVIVEGYTDVVMAHQYDVKNVVSILGTAMTESHVSLLRRFADRIVLLFDADTAGDMAAERSLENFLSQPIEIAIATMPEGKDPDEVLLDGGKGGFDQMIAQATDAVTFFWRRMWSRYNASDSTQSQREQAVDQFIGRVVQLRANPNIDAMRIDPILSKLSKETGIQLDAILKKRMELTRRSRRDDARGRAQANGAGLQESAGPRIDGARDKVEKRLLGAILLEPSHWNGVQGSVELSDFANADCRRLAERLWDLYRNEGPLPFAELLDLLDDELKSLAGETAAEAQRSPDPSRLIGDSLTYLSDERRREEIGKLRARVAQGDLEALRLLTELMRQPDMRRFAG